MANGEPLKYRLITGPDDEVFCKRVSELLDNGYELYGPPTMTNGQGGVIVGQAVVLKSPAQRAAEAMASGMFLPGRDDD